MIRIRQCRCNRCGPRRFWFIHLPTHIETVASFTQAVLIADAHTKLGAPS